jgi:hypothetical protein
MSIPIEAQCKGLPLEVSTYFNYCRSLRFDDRPDYNFLRRTLREAFDRNQQFDYAYDWTTLPTTKNFDNGKIKMELIVPDSHESIDSVKENLCNEHTEVKNEELSVSQSESDGEDNLFQEG